MVADAGRVGQYWIAAASVTGRSHLTDGLTGQDSYGFARSKEGAVAVAVADGLGSSPRYAQIGAAAIARALPAALVELALTEVDDAELVVGRVLTSVSRSVVEHLEQMFPGVEALAFASVCAACVIPAEASVDPIVMRVGDAAAFLLDGAQFEAVFAGEQGALNIVEAYLPSDDPAFELSRVSRDTRSIALVTDGLADDIYGSPRIREWLAESWCIPCSSHAIVDSLRFRRRGSLDDKTALLVWLPANDFGRTQ